MSQDYSVPAVLQQHAEERETVYKEALKPFAALLQDHNNSGADTKPIFAINDAIITLGDLRRAKALL